MDARLYRSLQLVALSLYNQFIDDPFPRWHAPAALEFDHRCSRTAILQKEVHTRRLDPPRLRILRNQCIFEAQLDFLRSLFHPDELLHGGRSSDAWRHPSAELPGHHFDFDGVGSTTRQLRHPQPAVLDHRRSVGNIVFHRQSGVACRLQLHRVPDPQVADRREGDDLFRSIRIVCPFAVQHAHPLGVAEFLISLAEGHEGDTRLFRGGRQRIEADAKTPVVHRDQRTAHWLDPNRRFGVPNQLSGLAPHRTASLRLRWVGIRVNRIDRKRLSVAHPGDIREEVAGARVHPVRILPHDELVPAG